MGNCINCYQIDINALELELGIIETMGIKITQKIRLDEPIVLTIGDKESEVECLMPDMVINADIDLINKLKTVELKHKSKHNPDYCLFTTQDLTSNSDDSDVWGGTPEDLKNSEYDNI